jgi:hypothetical protein
LFLANKPFAALKRGFAMKAALYFFLCLWSLSAALCTVASCDFRQFADSFACASPSCNASLTSALRHIIPDDAELVFNRFGEEMSQFVKSRDGCGNSTRCLNATAWSMLNAWARVPTSSLQAQGLLESARTGLDDLIVNCSRPLESEEDVDAVIDCDFLVSLANFRIVALERRLLYALRRELSLYALLNAACVTQGDATCSATVVQAAQKVQDVERTKDFFFVCFLLVPSLFSGNAAPLPLSWRCELW